MLRSPQVSDLNVLQVRLALKPLCGLAYEEISSFMNKRSSNILLLLIHVAAFGK